jgi:hypothetical protein
MTLTQARNKARDQIKLMAPTIPGILFSVTQTATVIPDEDSDGYGAYVEVTIASTDNTFTLLTWIASNDEVTT